MPHTYGLYWHIRKTLCFAGNVFQCSGWWDRGETLAAIEVRRIKCAVKSLLDEEVQQIGKPPIKATIKELKDFLGDKDITTTTISEVGGGENRFQCCHSLTRVVNPYITVHHLSLSLMRAAAAPHQVLRSTEAWIISSRKNNWSD